MSRSPSSWSRNPELSKFAARICTLLVCLWGCSNVATELPKPALFDDPGPQGPAPIEVSEAGFTDITAWSGTGIVSYQRGGSLVDVDGDGFDDLLLPYEKQLVVLKNRGDGSFYPRWVMGLPYKPSAFYVAELTGDAHLDVLALTLGGELLLPGDGTGYFAPPQVLSPLGPDGEPSVASFGDFDGDSRLDIYLGRLLVSFLDDVDGHDDSEADSECFEPSAERRAASKADEGVVLGRNYFGGQPPGVDRLLLSGSSYAPAYLEPVEGMYTQAAAIVDMDGDGALDIFVGSEGLRPDIIYRALGEGRFRADYAFPDGVFTSAMGFDAVDFDGDGVLELYVADDGEQGDRVYRWDGQRYALISDELGFGATSWLSAWGSGFFDLDHDGDLDFFAAHGVPVGVGCPGGGQPNIVLQNDGQNRFERYEGAPGGLDSVLNSRAALFSDIDQDGDIDVFIQNVDGPPQLLRNDFPKAGYWVQIRLWHPTLSPVVGARVDITQGDTRLRRDVIGTPSFGGSSSNWLHFGLPEDGPVNVRVTWPDGVMDELNGVPLEQFVTISYQSQ